MIEFKLATIIDSGLCFEIGCGFNLCNKYPTVCINDMITQLNKASGQNLPLLTKEKFFAIVFNQLEKLLVMIDQGEQDKVLQMYYKYWLHGWVDRVFCSTRCRMWHLWFQGVKFILTELFVYQEILSRF